MSKLPHWAKPPQYGAYATETGWFCPNHTMLVSHRGLLSKVKALHVALDIEEEVSIKPAVVVDTSHVQGSTVPSEPNEPVDPEELIPPVEKPIEETKSTSETQDSSSTKNPTPVFPDKKPKKANIMDSLMGDDKDGGSTFNALSTQDLTVIKGLGAKTQLKLNAGGIHNYKQLANINKQLAEDLDVRSGWVMQARELVK